jgi:hypothetical protein
MASILSFGLDHGRISAILCVGGGKLHRPQHFLDLIMARSLLDLDRTFSMYLFGLGPDQTTLFELNSDRLLLLVY